jgi:hypothetical protein
LTKGPIGFPETSVRNYQYALREVPGEWISELHIIIIIMFKKGDFGVLPVL